LVNLNRNVDQPAIQEKRLNSITSNSKNPRVAYFNERRLFVLDESIQPDDGEYMLVYSVQGHSLCLRSRVDDHAKLSFDVPPETLEFAIEQYRKWQSLPQDGLVSKLSDGTLEVSKLPHMRRPCPQCEGLGTWMDRQNKCSYGVAEEEANIVEYCETCHGHCYVEDLL